MSWSGCTRCGRCCATVGTWLPDTLPLKPGSMACAYLVETSDGGGTCSIYDERPFVCRVDAVIEATAELFDISVEDLVKVQVEDCNAAIDQAGMSPKWRVAVSDKKKE